MKLLVYYFKSLPRRVSRLVLFLFKRSTYDYPFWILEWPLLLLDLIAIPEMLQLIYRAIFWHQRKLSSKEEEMAKSVFQESIAWEVVRLNPNSVFASKFKIAFVTFHTIHFDQEIRDDILIHELVHIWQYQKYGSPYIIRALYAQHTTAAYDYGGKDSLELRANLADFNFEQMAEIIRDAYLDKDQNEVYNKYCKQLLE